MVVAYRLNPLTEALLDRILKVRQVNLVNLLLGRAARAGASAAATARRSSSPPRSPLLIRDERVRSAHRARV